MASRQEEPATEYEYDDEEEYETEDFMNQIGVGVERVLYSITWLVEAMLVLFVVIILLGLIFG